MTFDRSSIREGMTVYSSDGEKLGKVQSCDASMFVIEKGFFFPKDYVARYGDVSNIDGDEIRLSLSKDAFQQMREGGKEDEGWRAGSIETTGQHRATDADVLATDYGLDRAGSPLGTAGGEWRSGSSGTTGGTADQMSRSARTEATGEDIRVPIAEEELDVAKRDRQTGEVRLRKDVVTETKHIEVPVTREEVHVEHVAATNRDATDDDKLFKEDSVSVPIHEEEIEVRKRPVVKEEVRLQKERFTEQRAADAEVRKERVDVEGDDQNIRRTVPSDEDIGTTRRMDEPDETGATRRASDSDDPFFGMPPRDDT